MKKVSFIVLMLFSAICLSACNSPSNIKGEFLSKEYVLSLEEVKDFYDEFSVEGVDKEKVSLVSSDHNVLSTLDGKVFKASKSGQTYIFAKYKDKTVAKAKVNVRYKLATPQNFNLSDEGVLSWDSSFVVMNGNKVEASSYQVSVGKIIDLESEVIYNTEVIDECRVTLAEEGSYSVKVTALSDKENLDDSFEFIQTFHYGVMGVLENVEFEVAEIDSTNFGSQEATISWTEKENAKYDIYVEGFKLVSDSEENSYTYDYSKFKSGETVLVEIVAKDIKGGIQPSSTKINVNILKAPELKYTFNKEGKISWKNDEKASSYVLRTVDYEGRYVYKTITDRSNLEEILEGYDENIYDIIVMAVGGDEGGFYVSSPFSNELRATKIDKPEVSVEFVAVTNMVKVTFAEDEYVTDYKLSYNGISMYYSTAEHGLSTSIPLRLLPNPGRYEVEIVALPKADESTVTGVAKYTYGADSSDVVLNSDELVKEIYVLGQVGEISHDLNGDVSTFSLPKVDYANYYELYINDVLQTSANIFEVGSIVTCQVSDLSKIAPKSNGYDIKVVAGRKNLTTNEELALKVQRTKRLEILDAPQSQDFQTNGSFAWKAISEDCLYSYEIYKTDGSYTLTTGQTPEIIKEGVDQLQTNDTLAEGYYKIKVKAITKDANNYLDSDFYNPANILEANFKVTKDIETPNVVFLVDGNNYKLTIDTVENASLYQVYVDGSLDGQINSIEGLAQEEYIFSTDFASAGEHEVQVIALGGTLYDEAIYKQSQPFTLTVDRQEMAEYLVSVEYTDYDSANHEWLTVKEVEDTTKAVFLLNGSEVAGEDYRLDMADYSVYGASFKIGIIMKAGASEGNNYYLDSHTKEIEFVRSNFPTSIKYYKGDIVWTQNQADADENYISLIIDTASSSDYFARFKVPASTQSFQLQSKIDELRASDIAFDTAYRQVQKLQLKMLTYMNEESDKFYLPSFYGTTTNGTNTLDINLLKTPKLSLNTETQVLSWDSDVEGCEYDIYVDDRLVKDGYTLAKSINLSELGIDFTTQKKITVRARHDSYLDSEISQPIYVKQLVSPTSLTLTKDGNDYRASILINSDTAFVKSVQINGSATNVAYTSGGNIASFKLSDFSSTTNFAIVLVSKNDGSTNYYISSNPTTYTLVDFADQSFKATLKAETIEWNQLGGDIAGNNINPIRYILSIVNQGKTFTKTFENEYQVALSELETIAGEVLVGEVKVSVKAIVSEDYILTTSASTKGYFGEISSAELTTHKLQSFSDVTIEIVDGSGSTAMEKKINSSLILRFADLWSAFDDVKFLLKLGSEELTISPGSFIPTVYNFKKSGGVYQFTLYSRIISQFGSGVAGFTIQAICDKKISSEAKIVTVQKYATTQGGEVSDAGILTVKDRQNASYLVEISIEDVTLQASILKSEGATTLDLMTSELIENRFGTYTIKLLTFDEEYKILPANEVLTITGYKLQGLENVYITDDGNINFEVYMDDLTEVIFSARVNGVKKEFTPTIVEGVDNQFYISMIELLNVFCDEMTLAEGEYNFEFAVRSEGSVDSPWTPLTFNFAAEETPVLTRGRDLDKDYIIFNMAAKSDSTVSFKLIIKAQFPETTIDEEGNEIIEKVESTKILTLMESEVIGWWVTTTEGTNGYFATEKGTETDLIYTECYAICVNDLLADLDYGWAEINVARIGKTGEKYYQYNETVFNEYKLNKVNDDIREEGSITVKDNYLNFTWTQKDIDETAKDIAPSAYYVIFINSEGEAIKRETTFVCSLDLRKVGLASGSDYTIRVVALSAEKNVIASDICESIATLQYTTPIGLEVKDGKIQLDETEFINTPFMQDIINYFAQTTDEEDYGGYKYHNLAGLKQYTSPYFFTPALLDDLYVTLRFVKLDSSGAMTNEVYTRDILGTWLFPNIEIDFNLPEFATIEGGFAKQSYITLLQKYYILKLATATSTEATSIKSMIEALSKSPCGIGDNAILFDNIGRYIPSGDYLVSIIQTKSNQYIESTSSTAVKMYVSASPEISIQAEEIDNLTQYTADFTPSSTMNLNADTGMYEESAARRYKLSLRPMDAVGSFSLTGNHEFIITYNDSTSLWEIAYAGNILEGVVSNNDNYNLGLPGFKLNMSALRLKVNTLTGEDTIQANKLMRADVFTYAQDDGYVLNGKSGVFNVRYLDLSAESINFKDGNFIVNESLDSNSELLVKYKLASQGPSEFTTKFENGEAVLQFETTGLYDYVVLSLKGSISANTMNVESSSYAIANLYKLNAPTLNTSYSNLIINYISSDITYMDTLKFCMANNISLHEEYNSADKGYYYQSEIKRGTTVAPYVVGSKDINGDTLYPSELMASTFYAFLNGNSGTFTLSEEKHAMADYLLEFSEGLTIMTSAQTSINARMLAYVDGYDVIEGNLVIDDRHVGRNIVSDEFKNDLSGNIVFKVEIAYFVEDNDNPGYALEIAREEFYSERERYSELTSVEQIFSGLNFNESYDYFQVSVTCLGARRANAQTPNAILTVEGTYVVLVNSVYFYDDGAHVLRSQTQTAPYLLARTLSPYLAEGSKGIRDGNINFVIDKSIYYASEYGEELDTARRISFIAKYTTASGEKVEEEIEGIYSFSTKTEAGEENNVYVSLTPLSNQLNDAVGAIDLYIYAYGNATIISRPLVINTIYKLPSVDSYYSVKLQDGKTLLDFSSYFDNISINNDNTCYKVVVTYVDSEGEKTYTLTSSSSIQTFIIPEDATILSIQVQDGQDQTETSAKKLLYSDKTSFDVIKTDITGLVLTWNSTEMRFEWAWEDGRTDNYEYSVSITVSGKTTTEVVTTNYYLPKDRGLIANGGFEIKARKLGEKTSSTLYTYSDTLTYNGEELEYSLFSGGNGSRLNPYLIRNDIDFANMSKRNRSDFYFKLDTTLLKIDLSAKYTDAEKTIVELMQDFNGHFDGNGCAIQISSSQVFDLNDQAYTTSLTGYNNNKEFTINQYSSLFRNLSLGASIKNLNVEYVIDYDGLDNSSIMFAPLCVYNYGTIDNVKIKDIDIKDLYGFGDSNLALVGGLAGVNYGSIINCNNTDEFDYKMYQQLNLTFGYAGMTIFNVGNIENCYNSANKKITVTKNNNIVYMAGITLTNSGAISKAGNDGALYLAPSTDVSSMTGYYAGITVANNNGTLEFVYNNGIIETTSSYGAFYFGGIAYVIASGQINTLVVTVSGQPIVKSCSGTLTDKGSHYAPSNSETDDSITTSILSSQTIDCGNGYVLKITSTASGWKATISK